MTSTATTHELIQNHHAYAKALAMKARKQVGLPKQVEQEELEGWAMLGLVQAAERFNASRGVAFTTFAYRRVIGSVLNGIGKMHDAPASVRDKARKQQRLQDAMPGEDALGQAAEQAEAAIVHATRRGAAVLALDSVQETQDRTESNPLSEIVRREDLGRLRETINALPADLKRVVELHHFAGQTMAEVGKAMGISTPTVCRWNRKALDQIALAMGVTHAAAC